MNWLTRFLFGERTEGHRDEDQLREEVAVEKARFVERNKRAERVLADFHRADEVIRGTPRSVR